MFDLQNPCPQLGSELSLGKIYFWALASLLNGTVSTARTSERSIVINCCEVDMSELLVVDVPIPHC